MQFPTNRDFPPVTRCMQTLDVLIKESSLNVIVLAERAIDEFLQRQDDLNIRTGDLRILKQEINAIRKTTTGKKLEFVNLINDYMTAKYRELQRDS